MHRYLFVGGRHPDISLAEITSVFSQEGRTYEASLDGSYITIETPTPINARALMLRLGGTVKIGYAVATPGTIEEKIIQHLISAQPNGKIIFSLSGQYPPYLPKKIKARLTEQGRSVRYIEIKNTATILHNSLIEKSGDVTIIHDDAYNSIALQPIEIFSRHDFGRPKSDARSGMLPPKLARIMINLAQMPTHATLLDPFCGSGTILMEALALGYAQLVGSDISHIATQNTQKNLAWVAKELGVANYELRAVVRDVKKVAEILSPSSIDAIVTEPYLGKPLTGGETKQFLLEEKTSLEALYREALDALTPLLKPNGRVVMIIPAFRYGTQWIYIQPPKTSSYPPLFYARPNQRIGRQIWQWKKSSS